MNDDTCHLDIETFSEEDLKSAGVYRYAEHPSTEVLCMAYRFGNGPVTLWIPRLVSTEIIEGVKARHPNARILDQTMVPDDLRAHIESGWEIASER